MATTVRTVTITKNGSVVSRLAECRTAVSPQPTGLDERNQRVVATSLSDVLTAALQARLGAPGLLTGSVAGKRECRPG